MALIVRDIVFTALMLSIMLFFFYSAVTADYVIERMSYQI